MTAELMPFTYEGATVRTVVINAEPWFVARDICNALGLPNLSMALQRLAADEKGVNRIDTLGGQQEMAIVSESGMYALVLRSDKPEAQQFRRWVTGEVLPALRKAGTYSTAAALPDRKALARMVIEAEDARERAEAQVAELAPKADAFDSFLNGQGLYHVGTVGRMIGIGQTTLFKFLYDQRVLIPTGPRRKQPYANPKFAGWFRVKTHDETRTNGHTSCTTLVTPVGAEGIRLLAIDKGLIEPQLIALPTLLQGGVA